MWGRALAAVLILFAIVGVAAAIEADTNIRLDPHPSHISFYNNSAYITGNYTNQESANVTIKFELFNVTDNSTDSIMDFGEFAVNTTSSFTISTANFSTVGRYRAAMYAIDGAELCAYWIAVRSNTSSNYEKLHGSVRFSDADGVPSVSFIEPISGRGIAWTTDSISLTHSLELYEFNAGATAATGTLTFSNNTTDGETVNISTDRYEFDTEGNTTGGNIAVDISGGNNNSSMSCSLFAAAVTASDTAGVGASCGGSVVTLTADSQGTSGNSITTTETCTNATFATGTLTGGGSTAWNAAAGGNCTFLASTNTSGNETNWLRSTTYTLGQSYMMLIYSHDHELLDMHVVVAVVPTSNVVQLTVRDVETNERIMSFTANMMDIPKVSTSGEATWTNVTNGEHLITVSADGYATGTTTITMANSYVNTTVYLLRQSPYYTPHWVRFHLVNILIQPYSDVNVTVEYVSAAGENITLTGVTGTDGAVTFLLTPTFRHTITFTNASQGIDKTLTLYPKDTEYWIITRPTGGWADYEHDPTRYIHIDVSKKTINDTHAFINVTYLDDLNGTTALSIWINQTNASNLLGAEIMIDSWDSPGSNNSTSHSFIVENYRGQDYMVYVHHEHTEFGTTYTRAVRFLGILIDLGLPTISYAYISFAILFFMAAMFGATSTSIGGIVTCVIGWLLYAIGWLGILGLAAPICLALASTYAVGVILSDRARKGGYA